jgi:hypothetical protein
MIIKTKLEVGKFLHNCLVDSDFMIRLVSNDELSKLILRKDYDYISDREEIYLKSMRSFINK